MFNGFLLIVILIISTSVANAHGQWHGGYDGYHEHGHGNNWVAPFEGGL